MMDIMKIATDLLVKQFGGKVSEGNALQALSGLMGNGEGGLDISGIIGQMNQSGGLASLAKSWLGDGANSAINPAQIMDIFGQEKISRFSETLAVGTEEATSGLSNVLPSLIDKSSSGGNLLESAGGLGGALNMAKKLF